MCLEINVLMDLTRFWMENEAKLAQKSDQKSMSTSKGRFYKSTYKANKILMIFDVRGSKLGAKIDKKSIKK